MIKLFTNYYPFGFGEVFAENEVLWASSNSIKLCVTPLKKSSNKRFVPENINCDFSVAEASLFKKLVAFLRVIFSKWFYTSFFTKYPPKGFSQIKNCFGSLYRGFLLYNELKKQKPENIYYSYWFADSVFALALLKEKKNKFKTIKIYTRSHGYDCFEEQRGIYFPHREFVLKNVIKVFAASFAGYKALLARYPQFADKFSVSYLGVFLQTFQKVEKKDNIVNVVSCSNVVALKRNILLLNFLKSYAQRKPSTQICWTHIGAGDLLNVLRDECQGAKNISNLKIKLLGSLPNNELLKLYQTNYYDFFISLSNSEATPVSITEAMSCAIPTLATDAGGTKEAVIDGLTGVLLPLNVTFKNFEKGFDKMLRNRTIFSESAIKIQREKFDSNKNFAEFYNKITH